MKFKFDFSIFIINFPLSSSLFDPSNETYIGFEESTETETLLLSEITKGRFVKVWGQIGVIIISGRFGATMGPPADNEYAVEPVGEEIIIPSALTWETNLSSIKTFKSIIFDI